MDLLPTLNQFEKRITSLLTQAYSEKFRHYLPVSKLFYIFLPLIIGGLALLMLLTMNSNVPNEIPIYLILASIAGFSLFVGLVSFSNINSLFHVLLFTHIVIVIYYLKPGFLNTVFPHFYKSPFIIFLLVGMTLMFILAKKFFHLLICILNFCFIFFNLAALVMIFGFYFVAATDATGV